MDFMGSVLIIECLHRTPIEGLVPTEAHLASTVGLVHMDGFHLTSRDSLVPREGHLGSTENLAFTGALHLTATEGLVPTEGHLASTEVLVIIEDLHLGTLNGDCHLFCINGCHFTISDERLCGVSDIHQLGCCCSVSLIKGGHLGVKKKGTLGSEGANQGI